MNLPQLWDLFLWWLGGDDPKRRSGIANVISVITWIAIGAAWDAAQQQQAGALVNWTGVATTTFFRVVPIVLAYMRREYPPQDS